MYKNKNPIISLIKGKLFKKENTSQDDITKIKEDLKEDIRNQLYILKKYNDTHDSKINVFILITRRNIEEITDIKKLKNILNKVNKKIKQQFKQKIKGNLNNAIYKYLNNDIDKNKLKNFNSYKEDILDYLDEINDDLDKLEVLFLSTERHLTRTTKHLYIKYPDIIKFPDYAPSQKSGIRRRSAEAINKEENELRKLEVNITKEEVQNYIQSPQSIINETVKKVTWKNPIKEDCNLSSKI